MSDIPRLQRLLEFLKEEPNDPFLLYAIATEYNNSDQEKSLVYYEKLLNEHPSYVGTYYHAAALYADMDEVDKARDTYIKGMEVAEKAGDTKALSELKGAYQNFLFEFD